MTEPRQSRFDEVVNAHVDSYCWSNDGWECAAEGSVADARKTTRGQAVAFFAAETAYGDFRLVRVWKRYVRCWTRLDVWEYAGRERYEWQNELGYDEGPELPPDDWEPDWEQDPVWEFVHKSDPAAIPVWICGEKGTEAPQNPKPRVAA